MNEQLSGWLDGEADDLSSERVLRSLKDDPAAFDDARISLLIGDALRNEMALDMAFMSRFSDALQREPTVLAPSAVARPDHSHRRFVAFSAAASVAVFFRTGLVCFQHRVSCRPARGAKWSCCCCSDQAASCAQRQYAGIHGSSSGVIQLSGCCI